MNIRNILTGAFALATLVTAAKADVEIRLTGATAFRTATVNTIKAKFDLGASYTFAHNKAAGGVNGCDRATFKGTFPGIAGITTVRCSFNGSVEGIRAIALGGVDNPAFITDAALASPGTDPGEAANENANVGGSTTTLLAKFAFSDVRQSSTPIASPTLNPANAKVGVVVFSMIANEGAPAGLTNVTNQQFQALFGAGFMPLSLFTGVATDDPNRSGTGTWVFATGRNDGSGTRTTYMAETGLGITSLVNQYVIVTGTGNVISTIQRVPAGGGTLGGGANATSASTVWGQNVDGNGGYFSGSVLRTELARTSAAVTALEADGSDIFGGPVKGLLVSFLSNPDALNARQNGGKILGYNGVTLDSLNTASTLSTTDRDKVAEGVYSAWGFENLYYTGSLSTDENTFYTAVKAGIGPELVTAGRVPGIPLTEMNVSRPDDGAPIAP